MDRPCPSPKAGSCFTSMASSIRAPRKRRFFRAHARSAPLRGSAAEHVTSGADFRLWLMVFAIGVTPRRARRTIARRRRVGRVTRRAFRVRRNGMKSRQFRSVVTRRARRRSRDAPRAVRAMTIAASSLERGVQRGLFVLVASRARCGARAAFARVRLMAGLAFAVPCRRRARLFGVASCANGRGFWLVRGSTVT
jgi:hypothetical protein